MLDCTFAQRDSRKCQNRSKKVRKPTPKQSHQPTYKRGSKKKTSENGSIKKLWSNGLRLQTILP